MRSHPILTVLITLLLVNTLVTGRGAIQPLFLGIRKYLVLLLVLLLVLWLFYRFTRKRVWKQNIVPTIFLLLFLAASALVGPSIHDYCSMYFRYLSLNKVELADMPISGHERIQPVNSISTLINQEALSETEDATMPAFTRGVDGNYNFTAAVGPSRNYLIQRFSKDMYEVLNVPAHLSTPAFSKDQREQVKFEIGEDLLFSRRTSNAVIKRFGISEFLNCEPAEPVYLQNDSGIWVQVVPLVRWQGFVFPIPTFGGVYVIEQEGPADTYFPRVYQGKGIYYSPEEVLETPYLKGQNLQPEPVLSYIANSFKFANGFLAPMPGYHEGDIRIPKVANDQKQMPYITHFTIAGNGKLYNYFGLEPFEEEKKGLSLSLFIPGDSDEKIYFLNHRREKFIGSGAISSKIIESKKNYDWSVNFPAESRPFVRKVNGKTRFFWLTTVVSRAGENGESIGGGVPEICLTDAVYGKVIWIDQKTLMEPQAWVSQAAAEMDHHWESEQ